MLGWTNTASRDYEELVVNGKLDDDLDSMIKVLNDRKKAQSVPRCPECGEFLDEKNHFHYDSVSNSVVNYEQVKPNQTQIELIKLGLPSTIQGLVRPTSIMRDDIEYIIDYLIAKQEIVCDQGSYRLAN